MNEQENSASPQVEETASKEQYAKPELKRFGTLRELTLGGGGTKNEPNKSRTRF